MTAQPLMDEVPFGQRYWLTDLLAVGGMAEIYLARQNAMAGFEKDVVIKRLKPELAGDRRIRQMFLDEARTSAILNHTNIVHIYDVDEQDGVPYIAMEYIRGEEMNFLCRRGLSLGRFLPLEHAVELLRQAASGMGYFHARRNSSERDLDIVHCDISPTNLLVTEDGCLKIIDFGIARAKNQHFRDHSAIPGKLSYMSPEQALRESLDARSDVFSLGVVAYEITVGKRLFKGPAHEVFQRLVDCEIEPPTFVRREFPGHLEAIVMRALERFADDRYQSAYDLADDLEDFLREAGLKSGPTRIARYLDALTMAAGGERRPELISEAEAAGDEEDDLDFDRDIFEGYQPAPEAAEAEAADWEEFEESDRDVAAALGIDPDLLDPAATRTPLPSAMAQAALFERDGEGDEPDRGGHALTASPSEGRAAVPGFASDPAEPDTITERVPEEPGESAFAKEGDAPEPEPAPAPHPGPDQHVASLGNGNGNGSETGSSAIGAEGAASERDLGPWHRVQRDQYARARTPLLPEEGNPQQVTIGAGFVRRRRKLSDLPWIPISAAIVILLGLALYFILSSG